MPWRIPPFRFALRTLFLAVTVCAIALGFFFWTPYNRRSRLNVVARARIDPYELSIAGGGNPAQAPPELVAILGDSRLKHWNRVGRLEFVKQTQLLSYGQDQLLRFWDAESGRQTEQLECRSVSLCGPGACAFYLNPAGKIFRWDAATGKTAPLDLSVPEGVQGIKANDTGTHLAICQEAVSTGKTISVWSVADQKEVKKISLTSDYGWHFSFNHRADMLAFAEEGKVFLASLKTPLPRRNWSRRSHVSWLTSWPSLPTTSGCSWEPASLTFTSGKLNRDGSCRSSRVLAALSRRSRFGATRK